MEGILDLSIYREFQNNSRWDTELSWWHGEKQEAKGTSPESNSDTLKFQNGMV